MPRATFPNVITHLRNEVSKFNEYIDNEENAIRRGEDSLEKSRKSLANLIKHRGEYELAVKKLEGKHLK